MSITKTLTETASAIGDKVSEARESVEDIARSAGKKLDAGRDQTADGLRTAASTIRTTGHQSSEAIDRMARGAADGLDSTASYVEDCSFSGVSNAFRRFVQRHLAGSLLAAAVIGFVAASALGGVTTSRSGSTVKH